MPVRFLIADDVPAQQKLLANVVLFLGGESRFASNGGEALRLAQEEVFDIVLLDLSMPELGGVAAANRLMESWEALDFRPRIIAVTGERDEGTRILCRAVGMDGFIAKPFAIATVRKALKLLLVQGHCWPEGPARRILDVGALGADFARQSTGFDREVKQARNVIQELVKKLDKLTQQQRIDKSEQLTAFARKYGLLALEPLMATFTLAARDDEAALFTAKLAEQGPDFELAVSAIRSWGHHSAEPLRMSA